ncbi:hypothetical protein VTK73DRAFT_9238 [Phialemonium thermophilum]|uniref:Uncharacterized protein n=1 Tax=Phialemonium thermophilum TaxID=223376 RepID=A0ABR3W3I1_9PEZI
MATFSRTYVVLTRPRRSHFASAGGRGLTGCPSSHNHTQFPFPHAGPSPPFITYTAAVYTKLPALTGWAVAGSVACRRTCITHCLPFSFHTPTDLDHFSLARLQPPSRLHRREATLDNQATTNGSRCEKGKISV